MRGTEYRLCILYMDTGKKLLQSEFKQVLSLCNLSFEGLTTPNVEDLPTYWCTV
jgi:hypothetical protein